MNNPGSELAWAVVMIVAGAVGLYAMNQAPKPQVSSPVKQECPTPKPPDTGDWICAAHQELARFPESFDVYVCVRPRATP